MNIREDVSAQLMPETTIAAATGYALADLKINGITPFYSPVDSADMCLEQAHALLTVIAAGLDADEECGKKCVESALTNMRSAILAEALNGVASLLALSQHQSDLAASLKERVS